MEKKISLGQKVKDTASGFIGTVTARCEYTGGSVTIRITAPAMNGEHAPAELWVEEGRAEVQA
jgi:hypothetical protein